MESDFCTVIDDSSSSDSCNEIMLDNCFYKRIPPFGLVELPEQTQKRVRFSDDYCQEMFLDSIRVDPSTNPLTMQNELMRFILSNCYSGSDEDRAQFMCNAVGKGFHNVAHQAIFHENLTLDESQAVNPIDLPFHFLFAQLSSQLSKPCRKMLAAIVRYASLSATNICIHCSPDDCRFVWCEGPYSIALGVKTLHPKKVGSSEYYMLSLEDIIRNMFLTENFPLPFQRHQESAHGSSVKAAEWFQQHSDYEPGDFTDYVIKLITWTDAFSPFQGKDSNFQVHMCVATIGAADGDHSGIRGYPIWLGPEKESSIKSRRRKTNNEISGTTLDGSVSESSSGKKASESLFIKELNRLENGLDRHNRPFLVWHKSLHKIVRVRVCPFAHLADRPDKAKYSSTLDGGNIHQLFGWLVDFKNIIKEQEKKIECCSLCYNKLLSCRSFANFRHATENCHRCYSFDVSRMHF